jgi:5-methylcytosine-specific restriction endonuclease McrA
VPHNWLIPTPVKVEVWRRDRGECVQCGSTKNLHFDHDIPFSKGGSSLTAANVRLLCAKCNLQKSDKIPWHAVALCEGGFEQFNDSMHK